MAKFNIKTDFKWNGDKVKSISKDFKGKSIWEVGIAIQDQAVSLCPVDKGRLRGTIFLKSNSEEKGNSYSGKALKEDIIEGPDKEDVVYIGTNCVYAPYVEFNTRPHMIYAKNAAILSDGKNYYGKSVSHPGTQGQPFLRPAFDLIVSGKMLSIITKNGKQLFADYLT